MKNFKFLSFALALSFALMTSLAFTPNTIEDDTVYTGWTKKVNGDCDEPIKQCTTTPGQICESDDSDKLYRNNDTECNQQLFEIP